MNMPFEHKQMIPVKMTWQERDSPVKQVLQLGGVMAAVDDEPLVLEVELGLRAQLASEVLRRIWKHIAIVQC